MIEELISVSSELFTIVISFLVILWIRTSIFKTFRWLRGSHISRPRYLRLKGAFFQFIKYLQFFNLLFELLLDPWLFMKSLENTSILRLIFRQIFGVVLSEIIILLILSFLAQWILAVLPTLEIRWKPYLIWNILVFISPNRG